MRPLNIPDVLTNSEHLYEGDLTHYGSVVFNHAQNLRQPYHNFRHIFHVMWMCYSACQYYAATLSSRERRNLLIAALFHDFDHCGFVGHDDLNVERAVHGLRQHILEEDLPYFGRISKLVCCTQYPYKVPPKELDLCGQIVRDADMSQVFDTEWVQQVIFGLADEWNKPPIEILRMQVQFLRDLRFHTYWARTMFDINAKMREIERLLAIFFEPSLI